jgi:16S rRNA (cytosine1402-N4)-methyltransferase
MTTFHRNILVIRGPLLRNIHKACYHVPVLKNQCADNLCIESGGFYVDCTLGGGGHCDEILRRGGRVIGIDQDMDAIQEATRRLSSYILSGDLELHHANFKDVVPVVQSSSLLKHRSRAFVDGVLFDLGVSSFQIDSPSRGFAFRFDDCPLDMRMNQSADTHTTLTAEHVINNLDSDALEFVLRAYGEEPRSRSIAREIVASRPISSSSDLVKIISRLVPQRFVIKTLARCFQAFRIEVNQEMDCLDIALSTVHEIVRPGGRLVFLSYHSLEDRRVKELFKRFKHSATASIGDDTESMPEVRDCQKSNRCVNSVWRSIVKKAISPDNKEIEINSRARSAKLRVGERL